MRTSFRGCARPAPRGTNPSHANGTPCVRDSEGGRIETTTPVPAASTQPDLRAWADWILGSLLAHEPFSYSAVLVGNASGEALGLIGERWLSAASRPAGRFADSVPFHGSVCGAVFLTGTPVLVADVRQHPSYLPVPGGTMRSELAVPVLRAGRAIAVINVESPRVGGLDIEDLNRLTSCAALAAAVAPAGLVPAPEAA